MAANSHGLFVIEISDSISDVIVDELPHWRLSTIYINGDFPSHCESLAKIQKCPSRIRGMVQNFLTVDEIETSEVCQVAKDVLLDDADRTLGQEVFTRNVRSYKVDRDDFGQLRVATATKQRGDPPVAAARIQQSALFRQVRAKVRQ
ncbi:MAG: hypothetical protein NZM12_08935 [Steroidobacteraceae bacterium]|nr:hypothetical protein [Steroidobacteraceae bacterium]